ncbi:dicarboxylate/amino acid:cation symporter [Nocardioides sp. TRM66260-LWL]|uniref:dicarboxylate/amino acid:cation symporter n=1 Tax=Nocardioides sp. TRM66260-LWL TaxID=2874478 RepID=UPI001CC82B88|nr:dicarboxylate/amino acid:cation symporter [Nocardioides sp. TRM66260-LWL]MBZ5734606.1 dicarboxylate/amino acid:cation symporter [Nocardioides sp. TRM66260-LWL]
MSAHPASDAPLDPRDTTDQSGPSSPSGSRRRLPHVPFWAQILAGLVLGAALGAVVRVYDVGWLGQTLDTLGSTFVSLLRTVVVPLVFFAIVVSIARLREVSNAARLAAQTLLWFAITAAIAVTIGLAIGLLTDPGLRTSVSRDAAAAPSGSGSWTDFLAGLVPDNFLGLSASPDGSGGVSVEFNVLQIVVVGLLVGAAILKTGEKAEPFLAISESFLSVVQTVLWWIIRLSPIGTLGLIGTAVASYGFDAIGPLAVFTVDVYVGCAIVLLVVYPVLLRAHGLNPLRFFAGAWPALQLAFVSRSSVGTMPVTQYVTTRNLGVPREYASFAVPLGSTTKMDGCAAIYPALAAIFVAQFFGVDLGFSDYLLIAFVSVVGSAATAGLTGAVVMLTLTLTTLGLPLEGVGLLLAVDPILDMMRTMTNVAGQALVPTIVAAREGILDREVYDRPAAGDPVADPGLLADERELATV